MSRATRVLILSDMHCGHRVGLTPPKLDNMKGDKFHKIRVALWNNYNKLLAEIQPIDRLLFLGDAIDGDGKRSGGTELIERDIDAQQDMAISCLDLVRCYARKKYKAIGVYGTPYHAGESTDHERRVAELAGFEKIGGHEWVDIEGHIFDLKHKCGSSTVPHGRHTPIAKERLWNTQWAIEHKQPKADVILRGHVHYHDYCGDPTYLAMTCPALQGWGSKYGARQCSGIVHWGMIYMDVTKDAVDWHSKIVTIKEQIPEVVKL